MIESTAGDRLTINGWCERLSNEGDEQEPDGRHRQENEDVTNPIGRRYLKTALGDRIGWPTPELWIIC
jgi:hypothetical protein